MKKIAFISLITVLLMPYLVYAAVPASPSDLELSGTDTTMTVTWEYDSDDEDEIDGFKVYHSTSNIFSSSLDPDKVSAGSRSLRITGLDENTTYYAWVSAYDDDNERRTGPESIKTGEADVAPDTPTGFWITSLSDITETTVTLIWNKNSESDFSHYNITYGRTGITSETVPIYGAELAEYTFTGLTSLQRYYFSISAVDETGNESDSSDRIYVDTLADSRSPNTPEALSAVISGPDGEVTVSFDGNNSGMVDLDYYTILYGTVSGSHDTELSIGAGTSQEFTDLAKNTTYYFAVTSTDATGNTSSATGEVSLTVEDTRTFLSNSDEFQGGCFISDSASSALLLTDISIIFMAIFSFVVAGMALRNIKNMVPAVLIILMLCSVSHAQDKNTVGIVGGYSIPAEKIFDEIYEDRATPVTLFYDRLLPWDLSVDVGIGYVYHKGYAITTISESKTTIKTELYVVPMSSSLNYIYQIAPFIKAYAGCGLDLWYYREKTDYGTYDAFDDNKLGVGGYHGKAGLKLYTKDDRWLGKAGMIIETVYSRIDRFGKNDIDLGGWVFNIGVFYTF